MEDQISLQAIVGCSKTDCCGEIEQQKLCETQSLDKESISSSSCCETNICCKPLDDSPCCASVSSESLTTKIDRSCCDGSGDKILDKSAHTVVSTQAASENLDLIDFDRAPVDCCSMQNKGSCSNISNSDKILCGAQQCCSDCDGEIAENSEFSASCCKDNCAGSDSNSKESKPTQEDDSIMKENVKCSSKKESKDSCRKASQLIDKENIGQCSGIKDCSSELHAVQQCCSSPSKQLGMDSEIRKSLVSCCEDICAESEFNSKESKPTQEGVSIMKEDVTCCKKKTCTVQSKSSTCSKPSVNTKLTVRNWQSPEQKGKQILNKNFNDMQPLNSFIISVDDEKSKILNKRQVELKESKEIDNFAMQVPSYATFMDCNDQSKKLLSSSTAGIVTTKLRVQNLCCGKEVDLMGRELKHLNGFSSLAVNIVGRVAFVKHHEEQLHVSELVDYLNKLHLGVSIMESGSRRDKDGPLSKDMQSLIYHSVLVLILASLYIVVIVGTALKTDWHYIIAICIIGIGSFPLLAKIVLGWKKKQFIDINLLMLIAVIGTVILQEWMEGATVVLAFAIAEILQKYSKCKVMKMMADLVVQAPKTATLAESGKVVSVEDVEIGTHIVVCAGDKIPLDGTVVKGQGSVDESSMTGESVPTLKSKGSSVFGGTILQNGFLEVKTISVYSDSMMMQVAQLVDEAQAKASHTEKLLAKFAKVYTPSILVLSLLVFVVPAVLYGFQVIDKSKLFDWGNRALVVLLVACPCALLMAAPIVYVTGIGYAAKQGVLIKGGAFLEAMARLTVIALDKTGTLTEGRFRVAEMLAGDTEFSKEKLLSFTAAVEKKSSHPLAAAIVNEYAGCITDKIEDFGVNVGLPDVSNFKSLAGVGVYGEVEGHSIRIGNLKMMKDSGCVGSSNVESKYLQLASEGLTVVLMAVDNKVQLIIALADLPRESAKDALLMLSRQGVRCVMLTGDNGGAAVLIQQLVSADEVMAEMKPQDKLRWIERSKEGENGKKQVVAMVGDGVNDGPSLAAADVGIAIGVCGTALAIESAGVSLMNDNLTLIPKMIKLSKFCRRLVVENVILSVVIKLAVVVAALCVTVKLWIAVLADVLSLLIVILNGIRPLRWQAKEFDKRSHSIIA